MQNKPETVRCAWYREPQWRTSSNDHQRKLGAFQQATTQQYTAVHTVLTADAFLVCQEHAPDTLAVAWLLPVGPIATGGGAELGGDGDRAPALQQRDAVPRKAAGSSRKAAEPHVPLPRGEMFSVVHVPMLPHSSELDAIKHDQARESSGSL